MNNPSVGVGLDRETLPDIARRRHAEPQGALDWVGMSEIHQTIRVSLDGEDVLLPARVAVYVDLADPHARGIHMSRLYLLLDEHCRAQGLSVPRVKALLASLRDSHCASSSRAFVRFEFDYPVRRRALVSQHTGLNVYPVVLSGTWEDDDASLELAVTVTYSSTCPCSAALARQLIQRAFDERFADASCVAPAEVRAWLGTEDGIVATPHSQRSYAEVLTRLSPAVSELPIADLVVTLEQALGTPVQTAVKRADEQAFALLNGQNLMFCEDAARRLDAALQADDRLEDFRVRVEHHESLHPHNAVSVTTKGVAGGYSAQP